MGRNENIRIFQDTERIVKTNKKLSDCVKKSMNDQMLIPEHMQVSDFMSQSGVLYDNDAKVIVSKKRLYEAASAYIGKKICVHNFASATNPGGGVTKGSSAQEECLCRCSTLYFNLNTSDMWSGFYSPHRAQQDPIHNDDCIYTPNVVVIKTDTAVPQLMKESDWFKVNVFRRIWLWSI